MNQIKRLWPYLQIYKAQLLLIVLLGIIMSGALGGSLWCLQKLQSEVFSNKNPQYLYVIPSGFIILYIIHGTARFVHMYYLKLIGENIAVQLRKDLQQKYLHLNLNFHNTFVSGSGGLLSRTLNDVTVIQWGIYILADIVREPITAVTLVGYLLYLDWKLTLFVFTVVPFLFILLKSISKSLRHYSHEQQETMEDFTSTLKETLDGIRVIQSFNLEKEMQSRMHTVAERYMEARKQIIKREEFAGPASEVLASAVFAIICIYMGQQIIASRTDAGAFLAFIAGVGMLQPAIKKLQDAYVRLQPTVVAVQRVFDTLEDVNLVPQVSSPKKFPKSFDEIEFSNIQFAYGDKKILKNINLTVKRGQTIAFVGESGSGKSTLVNLIPRFFDANSGSIKIGGVDIKEMDLKDLRKNVALVSQDVFLFKDSIAKNIQAGDTDKVNGDYESAAKMANALIFIDKLPQSYQTGVGERGNLLSGGEKQRISIARAIYKDAPILILDEATSALDSASEIEVQKGLEELRHGRTSFVIAHRLSTIIKTDRILVFKNGEIVEDGTHQTLLDKQGAYFEFFQQQTSI